ncbi:MAG: hypothetical protein H7240_00490 [Glaciimonas sp.]|nr:hypothetical protein [Glaciimonas sp.]
MRFSHNLKVAIFLSDLRGGGAESFTVNSFVQYGYAVDMVLLCSMPIYIERDPPHEYMVICQGGCFESRPTERIEYEVSS